jgi:hypothetical protein
MKSGGKETRKILRKAYSYKKNGKTIYVKAARVKDVGKPGKTKPSEKVLPKLKHGKLSMYGYSTKKNELSRHRALMRAIRAKMGKVTKEKYRKVMRRVNVLATYTTRSQPKNSKIYKSDFRWLQNNYTKIK